MCSPFLSNGQRALSPSVSLPILSPHPPSRCVKSVSGSKGCHRFHGGFRETGTGPSLFKKERSPSLALSNHRCSVPLLNLRIAFSMPYRYRDTVSSRDMVFAQPGPSYESSGSFHRPAAFIAAGRHSSPRHRKPSNDGDAEKSRVCLLVRQDK